MTVRWLRITGLSGFERDPVLVRISARQPCTL